jgi:integrase
VTIIGIAGACRREELTELKCANITATDSHLIITIDETKTYKPRSFALVPVPNSPVKPLEIFRKYVSLRPPGMESPRFFFKYHDGKAACQNVGINTIGKIPEDIATFLGLENPEKYTGHSFRRSSASWLADSGADKDTIMRHGGWKSSTVAEGYIETSVESKKRVAAQILGNQNEPLNKMRKISPDTSLPTIDITSSSPGVHLEHIYSCTINIHVAHNK